MCQRSRFRSYNLQRHRLAALVYVTEGIHWGTADFRNLGNGVVSATVCGSLPLVAMEACSSSSLITIWSVAGEWVVIPAILGIVR